VIVADMTWSGPICGYWLWYWSDFARIVVAVDLSPTEENISAIAKSTRPPSGAGPSCIGSSTAARFAVNLRWAVSISPRVVRLGGEGQLPFVQS
jgi:hypothetical protein